MPILPVTVIQSQPDQYQQMLDNYSLIVEKTNQQLSLWYNPYGLMVGILTALIALATIFVTLILWYNGAENRRRIKKAISQQISALRKWQEESRDALDKQISNYKATLDSATGEGKERIESMIRNLEKERATLGANLTPQVVVNDPLGSTYSTIGSNFLANQQKHSMNCSKCGKSFEYYDNSFDPLSIYRSGTVSSLITGERIVHCSHCGEKNVPQ